MGGGGGGGGGGWGGGGGGGGKRGGGGGGGGGEGGGERGGGGVGGGGGGGGGGKGGGGGGGKKGGGGGGGWLCGCGQQSEVGVVQIGKGFPCVVVGGLCRPYHRLPWSPHWGGFCCFGVDPPGALTQGVGKGVIVFFESPGLPRSPVTSDSLKEWVASPKLSLAFWGMGKS